MTTVLLINQETIPHYRVRIYGYLASKMERQGHRLTVVSAGIQDGCEHSVRFAYEECPLSFWRLARVILRRRPDVVIYWVKLRYPYLFPLLLLLKVLRIKTVYWGHGSHLDGQRAMWLKRLGHAVEFWLSDVLLLYASHLRRHISAAFHRKVVIANNTLCFEGYTPRESPHACLARYGISTSRNVICMGRMQKRKRIDHLIDAFRLLDRPDVGLILVGPDSEGILARVQDRNIFKLGAIYGDERLDLLAAADVFCLPGAVGLSIVDAFYCGLPIVTEEGDESPEIMYLKDGINGFVVPRGQTTKLAERIRQLLDDETTRRRFSQAAREEICSNGHIDRMCEGFCEAIRVAVCGGKLSPMLESVRPTA